MLACFLLLLSSNRSTGFLRTNLSAWTRADVAASPRRASRLKTEKWRQSSVALSLSSSNLICSASPLIIWNSLVTVEKNNNVHRRSFIYLISWCKCNMRCKGKHFIRRPKKPISTRCYSIYCCFRRSMCQSWGGEDWSLTKAAAARSQRRRSVRSEWVSHLRNRNRLSCYKKSTK